MEMTTKLRVETDLLGRVLVPVEAYYGIQTQRAVENFRITDTAINLYPNLIKALAMVKHAAAQANCELGLLEPELADAILRACSEVIDGALHDQFVVDLIQGGAGTSTNMNANEVIANRALELLGHERGEYQYLSPNSHVNMSQSTNDVYPTAARVGLNFSLELLSQALEQLTTTLQKKAGEFVGVVKIGRTQLQDAVPMTLGQEFAAFAATLAEEQHRIDEVQSLLAEVNLGGTAIGTGLNTPRGYSRRAIELLAEISKLPLKPATDLVEATSDMGAFVHSSSVLKRLAVKLSKICNDLRLLSSGPRAGLNEINLPPMQPGSSIMPGKVNPVIPEAMNQIAYQVIGNDLSITMAAEAGQLQLNAMEPLIVFNLFQSIRILCRGMNMLEEKCIQGITANVEHCQSQLENSIGIVTALNPHIGYENSTRIAKQALQSGQSIIDIVAAEQLLNSGQLQMILNPAALVAPHLDTE